MRYFIKRQEYLLLCALCNIRLFIKFLNQKFLPSPLTQQIVGRFMKFYGGVISLVRRRAAINGTGEQINIYAAVKR